MLAHVRAVHYGERKLHCPEPNCDKGFHRKVGLKKHTDSGVHISASSEQLSL